MTTMDFFEIFNFGRTFKDDSGQEFIMLQSLGMGDTALVVKGNDNLPAQVYVVNIKRLTEVKKEAEPSPKPEEAKSERSNDER